MRLAYYPGCSLQGTAREYDRSVREVADLLGIELVELDDWNCCGASSAHMTNKKLALDLAVRNLELAKATGLELVVPCAACFQRLKAAQRTTEEVKGLTVSHMTDLLCRPEFLEVIGRSVKCNLGGLRLACYYGCLSQRPPVVTGSKNYEHPDGMDRIVNALGAESVRWSHKTECCSGSLTMTRPDIARDLVGGIVLAARRPGAQAMVTDCPMCQANLESRQLDLWKQGKSLEPLPVFFLTELIQLATSEASVGHHFKEHLVSPGELLRPFSMIAGSGNK